MLARGVVRSEGSGPLRREADRPTVLPYLSGYSTAVSAPKEMTSQRVGTVVYGS
jgi:hypothetical protein